jgi:dienelactone hydrolase
VRLLGLAAVLLAVSALPAPAAPRAADPCLSSFDGGSAVRLRANDGASIYGVEAGSGTTGVVLGHQYLSDHCEWSDFASELAGAGMRVLAIDFRGNGASTIGRGSGIRLDRDLAAAAARLRADGAERIYLVGASMGGTAALVAGSWIRPAVAGVVSLSGPTAFRGLDALKAVRRSTVPTRFLASKGDVPFAYAARTLVKAARAKDKAIALYAGGAHGSSLLGRPAAKAVVLRFLERPS